MTVDKFEYVWAESGDTTPDPTDEKIQQGWVGGDKPRMERFNNLQNRSEAKIQKLQSEVMDSFYRDAADAQAMLTTGLWDENWGLTDDTTNTLSLGGTKELRDMSVFFDSANDPVLLIADNANMKFETYDPRTLAQLDISDAMTDDLPNVGGETWNIESLCTDGTNVYATFVDTNAAPDEHRIQAWNISTWAVVVGWAATGTALPGTGTGYTGDRASKVIIADATTLATVNSYVPVVNSASTVISIVSRITGVISASGAGDAPGGVSVQCFDIISDGTNIFFCGRIPASFIVLSSCLIADPTTTSGGANYPLSAIVATGASLVACGPRMGVMVLSGGASVTLGQVMMHTFNATDADLDNIARGKDSGTLGNGDDKLVFQTVKAMAFDGINTWILGNMDTTAGASQHSLTKIDSSRFSLLKTDNLRPLIDMTSSVFIVGNEEAFTGASYFQTVFDGRDMWCLLEAQAGQTNSGKLFRLPLALLRS